MDTTYDRARVASRQRYDAFISYNHALDGHLVKSLQVEVERFASPWYRPRARRVFRDDANLAADPSLWSAIEDALARSNWFILMASPAAAASVWVGREVEYWLTHHGADRLLIAVTDGDLGFESVSGKVDVSRTTALPTALAETLSAEPRWVDMRWIHDKSQVDPADPRFRDCVADVAATISEVPKDSLVGDHVKRQHQVKRLVRTVISSLLILLAVAVAAGLTALIQRNAARNNQRIAVSRQLITEAESLGNTDPRTALRLGIAAQRIHDGGETRASLVSQLTHTRYAATLTGHTDRVQSVAFSPDGRTLASDSADKSVILWDVTDPLQPVRLSQMPTGDDMDDTPLAFSPDGKTLASASDRDADTIRLWDVTDAKRPVELGPPLSGHKAQVESIAFSPDGRTMATGSNDYTVILWDVSDPAHPVRIGRPLDGGDQVLALAFGQDRRTLVSAGPGGVFVWDLTDRAKPIRRGSSLATRNSVVTSLAFAPDRMTLATLGQYGALTLWDLTDPSAPVRLSKPVYDQSDLMTSVAFAPTGRELATASDDHSVVLWDVHDPSAPAPIGEPLTGHTAGVLSIAFSPRGVILASGGADDSVFLWFVTNAQQPTPTGASMHAGNETVQALAFSPDERLLATGGQDSKVRLWDISDRRRAKPLGEPLDAGAAVWSLAFSPDDRTLTAGNEGGLLTIWDVTNPAAATKLNASAIAESTLSLAYSNHGRTLAVGSLGTVELWDLTHRSRPKRLDTVTQRRYSVGTVAFAHDRPLLAFGYLNTVSLWDITHPRDPRSLGSLKGPSGIVQTVAFSAARHLMAAATDDRRIYLWDVSRPTQPRRMGDPLIGPIGSAVATTSIAFAKDGQTLATSMGDNTVTLWDLADPTRPRQLGDPITAATDDVVTTAISPDGRTLATGSQDRTAVLWDLTALNTLRAHDTERACALAGGLTRNEWRHYIAGIPFEETCDL